MDNNQIQGKVQTVLGQIESDRLGFTLAHEHLFSDMTGMLPKPLRFLFGRFKKLDVDKAISEVELFKQAGGGTIVDVTPSAIGIDDMQRKIARVSQATGVNIVCGTAYYIDPTWTKEQREKSAEEIAKEYITHIEVGFGDTGIKAGVIGEIGVSWPITQSERNSLKAAAIASKKTGVPISIHSGFNEAAPKEIITMLLNEGVTSDNIIIGHMEFAFAPDKHEEMLEFAKLGSFFSFDCFAVPASQF